MSPRRSVAVLLSLVLSAAALATTSAVAVDDDGPRRGDCGRLSEVRLRVLEDGDGRLSVIGAVFSDDDDLWEWRMKHNDDLSAEGRVRAKDADRSLRIQRSMIDLTGPDTISFWARNTETGETCRRDREF